MIAQRPPMGWNSWNTFGPNISDELIRQTADTMVERGFLQAGYEYLVIDDCWAEMARGADGRLVPDAKKFPNGMKAVADYVHSKGLKFGMYSCAGVRTCAGYPASFDHEYVDAETFAEWGVDFLKYDFCNFPTNADCKMRYLTMSMALKASGREILFSACNWGREEPWGWMRSIGAHMYRSTGDILDNFKSFTNIAASQLKNFCASGPSCYNDMDMLTVGMYGKGNVAIGKPCTESEYRVQFALWCLFGAPLMMGADMRTLSPEAEGLMKNADLIRINQDPESRPPYIVGQEPVFEMVEGADEDHPFKFLHDKGFTFIKHLTGGEFAVAFINLHDKARSMQLIFADAGIPYCSGFGLNMRDLFTGEELGLKRDFMTTHVEAHDVKIFTCRLARADG